MYITILRRPLAIAAILSFAGIAAFASPSLAFNPQPDPPGKTRINALPIQPIFAKSKKTHAPPSDAKPDCRNRHGQNRCY